MNTTESRCKNCKHWRWWPGFEHYDTTHTHKPCELLDEIYRDGLDRASVGNSVDSYILTGPDFGCIHFSNKSNT